MKWVGISGSWRKTNKEIEKKLRSAVAGVLKAGNGIISGGALGVDFIALEESLKHDPEAKRIRIFLPTTLEVYKRHYRKHAQLGTITKKQAEGLISQLTGLKRINSEALIESTDENFTEITKKEMYYKRNLAVAEASDELVAFRVITEQSEGLATADTIEKAKNKGIPVKVFQYDLSKE